MIIWYYEIQFMKTSVLKWYVSDHITRRIKTV